MTHIEFEEAYNNLFNTINPKNESIIRPIMIKRIFEEDELTINLRKIFNYYESLDPNFYMELAKRIKIFVSMFIREYQDFEIFKIDENNFSFEGLLNGYKFINKKLETARKSEKEKYNSLLNAFLNGVRVSLYEYKNTIYKDDSMHMIKKQK